MTPHNTRVDAILAKHPGARTTKFRISVQEAVRPTMVEEWQDDREHHKIFDQEARRDLWVRPDAYLIVPKAKLIICWEVEYAHRYDVNKYDTTFWFLDEFCWGLKVVVMDAVSGSHYTRDIIGDVYRGLDESKAESLLA